MALAPTGSRIAAVLQHFPPVNFAFAYGSGVHHQPGLYDAAEPTHASSEVSSSLTHAEQARVATGSHASTSSTKDLSRTVQSGIASSSARAKGPMLDFIFAVTDAHDWHKQVRDRGGDARVVLWARACP